VTVRITLHILIFILHFLYMTTHYFGWEDINSVPSKIDPKSGGGGGDGGVCA